MQSVHKVRPPLPTAWSALARKVRISPPPPALEPHWTDILLVSVYALALPFAVYLGFAVVSPVTLGYILRSVATLYAATSLVLIVESLIAAPRRSAALRTDIQSSHSEAGNPFPPLTALIVAYLPNEEGIIVDTVRSLLTKIDIPPDQLQVILAYNTPQPLPIENELYAMAEADPRLLVLRVENSSSKAENINAALPHITGEITAIFDSDHHPEPLCFRKALRWFRAGYDVVQGRCMIRNDGENWLTKMTSVEFGTIYTVSHTARSLLVDTAIFGGSNGYWRTAVLRDLRMDPSMLTEDIDIGLRALLRGYHVLHDRSIISTELAPARLSSWYHQRLRWAHGWHQVTHRHSRAVLKSPVLNRWQKLYWVYLLPWRETYEAISPQVIPIVAAIVFIQAGNGESWLWDPYLLGTTVLTLLSGALSALVAYKHMALTGSGNFRRRAAVYIVLSPIFALIRSALTLVAWLREARGQRSWIVTARGRHGNSLEVPAPLMSLRARTPRRCIRVVVPDMSSKRADLDREGPHGLSSRISGVTHATTAVEGSVRPEVPNGTAAARRRRIPAHVAKLARSFGLSPLLGVLVLQSILSLTLQNTAFQDEALYLYAGREIVSHFFGGPPPEPYATYFSGSPYIYPVVAGALDMFSGLEAARLLSLFFMLLATTTIYLVTNLLYNRDSGVLASALFGAQASVLFIGHFATYDAMCVAMLALGCLVALRAGAAPTPWPSLLVGAILLVTFATKHASLLFAPSLLAVLGWQTLQHRGWRQGLFRATLAVTVLLVGMKLIFIVSPDTAVGFQQITLQRPFVTDSSRLFLARSSMGLSGGLVALGIAGFLLGGRRRFMLSTVLLGSALLVPVYHIYKADVQSMYKHIAFGLVFAAPLAGYGFAHLGRGLRMVRTLIFLMILGSGVIQSRHIYENDWPNYSALIPELGRQVRPGTRVFAEQSWVARYYLQDDAADVEWIGPYGFDYKDSSGRRLLGVEAYRAAVADGYFDVVELDFLYRPDVAAIMEDALQRSNCYELVAEVPFRVHWAQGRHRIWRRYGLDAGGSSSGGTGYCSGLTRAVGY